MYGSVEITASKQTLATLEKTKHQTPHFLGSHGVITPQKVDHMMLLSSDASSFRPKMDDQDLNADLMLSEQRRQLDLQEL